MSTTTTRLFVGNKNYSSWSMRPWLCLQWAEIVFDEQTIALDQPGYGKAKIAEIVAVSPTGKVPVLHAGPLILWDSLAIAEWAHENTRAAPLWPDDPTARALARAVTAEMHSGFASLRTELPMNIRRRCPAQAWSAATRADLARVEDIWTTMRSRFGAGGPWLFGTRSIADAFFTPVATRLRTYDVSFAAAAQSYRDQLLGDTAFRALEARAEAETTTMRQMTAIDSLYA